MPFWLITFFGLGLNYVSIVCRQLFNLLYAIETLHMTTAQYGRIMACGSVVLVSLAVPLGFLVDRFHPLRMIIAAMWLVIGANIFGFFFCHDTLPPINLVITFIPHFNSECNTQKEILGCSQVVRHGTLTPAFAGSSPATPAIKIIWCHRRTG